MPGLGDEAIVRIRAVLDFGNVQSSAQQVTNILNRVAQQAITMNKNIASAFRSAPQLGAQTPLPSLGALVTGYNPAGWGALGGNPNAPIGPTAARRMGLAGLIPPGYVPPAYGTWGMYAGRAGQFAAPQQVAGAIPVQRAPTINVNQLLGGIGGGLGRGAMFGGMQGLGLGNVTALAAAMGPAGIAFAGAATAAQTLTSALVTNTNAMKDYIVQSTLLAARVETLGVSMNKVGANAGFSTDEMAQFEKSVTDMNITTQSARQSILFMAEAELDFSKAGKLARVAQDAAVIGNINSSDAFQRLTWAVERGEPRMLRRLGLNVSFERAYNREAAAIGTTVKALTEQEKAEIRLNEVLRVGARLQGTYEAAMTTASKRILSLQRLEEQVQLRVGEMFTKSLSEGVFAIYNYMDKLEKYLTRNKDHIDGISESLGYMTGQAIKGAQDIAKAILTATGVTSGKDSLLAQLDVNLQRALAARNIASQSFAKGQEQRATAVVSGIDVLKQKVKDALPPELVKNLEIMGGTLVKSADGLKGYTDIWAEAIKQIPGIKDYADALEKVNKMTAEEVRATSLGMTVTQMRYRDQMQKLLEWVQQYRGLQDEILSAQEEAENERLIRQQEFDQKTAEEDKRLTENLMDNDIAFANKNADVWESYYEKLQDLSLKQARDLEDTTIDYSRDAAELMRKYNDDQQKAAIDYSYRRVEIERDLADEIEKIRNDYAFESEELIRKRDAIGLLRLKRETAHRLGEVKSGAKTERETARVEYEKQQAERRAQLDIEKRELAIHEQEKIEDLNRNLARERQDAATSRDRALREAQKDWQREREELNRNYARRRADLKTALDNENALAETKLNQQISIWTTKLTSIVNENRWAVNAIQTMWANLLSNFFGTGGGGSLFPNIYQNLPGSNWPPYSTYGQGGQVSWSLANSRYAPPAAPVYSGPVGRGGSRNVNVNIKLDGNGILDESGRSQVIGIVREVVHNALAG